MLGILRIKTTGGNSYIYIKAFNIRSVKLEGWEVKLAGEFCRIALPGSVFVSGYKVGWLVIVRSKFVGRCNKISR